jgi:RNA polymerase sigma-70 factor (ECF subfamily)
MSTPDQETTYTVLRQNREKGLQLLYEQYGTRLYSYAMTSWQLSEDEAWELVYDTLLKTISSSKQYEFESEKKFGSFIFTVFCNQLRRYYRDEKRRTARISFLSFDEALFDEAKDSPTLQTEREVQAQLVEQFVRAYWDEPDHGEADEYLACLRTALDELEDWERVLLLQRAQQIPYSEIASFVNKPADQLKVYHQRARKKLLRRFTDTHENMKQRANRDEHKS